MRAGGGRGVRFLTVIEFNLRGTPHGDDQRSWLNPYVRMRNSRTIQLPIDDALRVKSAEMWLEVGQIDEALLELDALSPSAWKHPWPAKPSRPLVPWRGFPCNSIDRAGRILLRKRDAIRSLHFSLGELCVVARVYQVAVAGFTGVFAGFIAVETERKPPPYPNFRPVLCQKMVGNAGTHGIGFRDILNMRNTKKLTFWAIVLLTIMGSSLCALAGEADIKIPPLDTVKFDRLGGVSGVYADVSRHRRLRHRRRVRAACNTCRPRRCRCMIAWATFPISSGKPAKPICSSRANSSRFSGC